mgnify:CR=1 FL=1
MFHNWLRTRYFSKNCSPVVVINIASKHVDVSFPFFLTKRCNNLLNVWTNYSGLMRNHSFFYQTQLLFEDKLLVGCFVEIVVLLIISGTLVMAFFGVYITWNNLSKTDWPSILKDWIGLTVIVWKLQIKVDMAKSYTKIRRVKYDEPMREREKDA